MRDAFHLILYINKHFAIKGGMMITYVIMKIGVADSNPITGMGDIKETIIIILIGGQISRQINMINPDICGFVQADSVPSFIQNALDPQVSKNHVIGSPDLQANPLNHCEAGLARATGLRYDLRKQRSKEKAIVPLPASPKMVLLEVMLTVSTGAEILPRMIMTAGPSLEAACFNCNRSLTTIGAALAPPVVPLFSRQKPMGHASVACSPADS
jgi:hypothetical protein